MTPGVADTSDAGDTIQLIPQMLVHIQDAVIDYLVGMQCDAMGREGAILQVIMYSYGHA